jgi:tetratricopeptide (TPR) repeat protein
MNHAHWKISLAALALAALSVAWLDPHAQGREGNRLFAAGKYEDAAKRYNEGLVDQPDSAALHFNLGDANYRQKKYDDAIKAFQQVAAGEKDPKRAAGVAYNIGNAKYRLGAAAESKDPKTALTSYAEALIAYRRAMGLAPNDDDIKFNYEFVQKKLDDLKKKLEEQKKKQEQQKNQQQNQSQQQQQQQQQGQQSQSAQQDQQQQQQGQQQQQQAQQGQEPNESTEQKPQGEQAVAQSGDQDDGKMSRQEAMAVLDSQRDQEVRPDEVIKKLQGAQVAEPAQDW